MQYILLVFIAIFLILGFIRYIEINLIYAPSRKIEETPADKGYYDFEDIQIETEDGITISGWFVPADSANGTVMLCHGNAGNISHRLDNVRIYNDLGYNILLFDYRGFGLSQGSPDEIGTYRDVQAAWDYLIDERSIPPEQIVLHGRSLGGALASYCAKENTPEFLIIESTFTSIPDICSNLYPWLPARILGRVEYPVLEYVSEVKCPILVIHSTEDEMIPFEHGESIYEVANEPKRLLPIRGDHNTGFLTSGQMYIEGLEHFLGGGHPLRGVRPH